MGLEEERKKMGDKEGRGGRQVVEEEKKGKEGGLKPDSRNSGPAMKILLSLGRQTGSNRSLH